MKKWAQINPLDPTPWLMYAVIMENVFPEESFALYEKYLTVAPEKGSSEFIDFASDKLLDLKKHQAR